MTAFVIIGGSDAGISAALRARDLDAECEITLVVADRFPNFSAIRLNARNEMRFKDASQVQSVVFSRTGQCSVAAGASDTVRGHHNGRPD